MLAFRRLWALSSLSRVGHASTYFGVRGVQHTYSYDGAGNMTQETAGAGTRHTFTYTGGGLVKTRATAGSPTINYVYDANGKLVRKYADGGQQEQGTIYIGDTWEKKLDAPAEVTKYYYANGQRIAMRKQPSGGSDILNFLVNDHLGGTALVLTSSNPATEVARLRYYPFGGPRLTSGTVPTDKRFTGQQLETTSGNMYHYGARLYNADIGRFISADTIVPEPGNPQALNRYSYVNNNPIRYNDPTGHKWDDGAGGCTAHTCDEELGWDGSSSGGSGGTYCGPWAPGQCPTPTPRPTRPPSTAQPTMAWRDFESEIVFLNEDRSCNFTAHADCVFVGGWGDWESYGCDGGGCSFFSYGDFASQMEGFIRSGKLDVFVRLAGTEHNEFAVANVYWRGGDSGTAQLSDEWTNNGIADDFTYGGTVDLTGPAEAVEIGIYIKEGGFRYFWYDLTTDTVPSTATHVGAHPQ